jgi:hypothetical protein
MVRGTIADPMTLADALTSPLIKQGHTLYLRGGTYAGPFTSTLVGVAITPYQDEKPVIDGSLTINGSDTTWHGIEIMYSGWAARITAQSGGEPTDIPYTTTLSIFGPRTTLRRCVIHDLAGPGFWTPATDSLIEECISYNNGWGAPDRGHGHGLYTQNAIGTKTIKRCVFAGGYSDYSIHAYVGGGSIQGFDVQECVSIGKTMLFGGGTPVDRLSLTRNVLFGGALNLGYKPDMQNGSAALTDTILANGATRGTVGMWADLVETGTDTTTGNRVLVYGGLVIVFNESKAASVAVPKTGRYVNCQNPAESVVLAEGAPLPMTGWTVATPYAASAPITTWDSHFGVFLVEDL